jgi:hypothetical protein
MIGLRHATALMAVVALLFDAHTGVWAFNKKRTTDTFEQRFPPDQVPTPPAGEQAPRQPPVPQTPTQPPANQFPARPAPREARPAPRETEKNMFPGGERPGKLATVTTAPRVASARRSRSRVVVKPRSFLDAGTEVLPGERKFLDYALPPLHTPSDVVTNTGGRVGWHRSPLPGPLFPGTGPW